MFAGAPLGVVACSDWAHIAKNGGFNSSTTTGASALRLADASGLTGGLPLGCGEIVDWPDTTAFERVILSFAPGTSIEEVLRSVAAIS